MLNPLYTPKKYFFLRGHNRSGTTWLARLLNLHPQICCMGEFYLESFKKQLAVLCNIPHCLFHKQDLNIAAHIALEHFTKTVMLASLQETGKDNVVWVGDRTPEKICPIPIHGAPVFLIVRDGRDVLVSKAHHVLLQANHVSFRHIPAMLHKSDLFRRDQQYFLQHPHELLDCEEWVRAFTRSWNTHVMADAQYIEQMPDTDRQHIKVIQYEELHAHTEQVRAELYEFLGVSPTLAAPLDSITLPGCPNPNPWSLHRRGQPRQWLEYFTEATEQWFLDEASEALKYYGYIDA